MEALPGTAWRPCPEALPGSLVGRPCLKALPQGPAWKLCVDALLGGPASRPCLEALPGVTVASILINTIITLHIFDKTHNFRLCWEALPPHLGY